MKSLLTVLAGLLALGALTMFCANRSRPDIEADLGGKSQTMLAGMGLGAAKAAPEGQIITLTGEVPDEATRLKAAKDAYAIFGVSEVRNLLTVSAPPATPVMTPQQRQEAITCQQRFSGLLSESIRYETGSAVISAASHGLLNKLAEAAKACPDAQIEVGGHTDPRGSRAMNMTLSQRRAESVVKYLGKQGVDVKRFTAVGYGPDKPIAENSTPQGMQKNRRTEFSVKGI